MYTFHEGYQRILGTVIDGIPERTAGLKNLPPMNELLDLKGKKAIVTGGAMGLGSCIVYRLCEAGASVMIADVAEEYANKVIEFASAKGYDVKFAKVDVRKPGQIKDAVDFTVAEFGGIDILVCCAALWTHNTLDEITEEIWDESLDTNLKGTFFFVKEVARVMEKQGNGGKIVDISSVAGISCEPGPVMFDYVASKSAVLALTKSLARGLKPLGININCVIPGGMMTPGAINTQMTEASKEVRSKMVAPPTPTADPDEIARVVFMLTTKVSDFMHGASIIVDGGAHLNIG
jgi:NAD(P)-dependent dehydrogenase (short-subunit alcohol dehydrogenase family)